MADYLKPHRFSVYGISFDVTFDNADLELEYGNPKWFTVTYALARKVGTVKTLGAKSILNPKDTFNHQLGQKKAFERIINLVWASWVDPKVVLRKEFSKKIWIISFAIGMWDEE